MRDLAPAAAPDLLLAHLEDFTLAPPVLQSLNYPGAASCSAAVTTTAPLLQHFLQGYLCCYVPPAPCNCFELGLCKRTSALPQLKQ
jgi:hypothetical protein